jgi:hypothetical protein
MTTFHVSPAATVASIVILGAVVVGGTRERPMASSLGQPILSIQGDRCNGGTEVSSFVCRNTWIAMTKRSVR